MKKSLLSFLTIAFILLMSAGAAYAWFSSQGKVQGIGVSVGSSGLLVNGASEWVAGVNFANIVPGWESDPIAVTLENVSQGEIAMSLKANILFTGSDFDELADAMLMAVEVEGAVTDPDFQTLKWWSETGKILDGGDLLSTETRDYNLLFKLPSESVDTIQSQAVDLSVLFTGVQVN